jgi:hypothetical protein
VTCNCGETGKCGALYDQDQRDASVEDRTAIIAFATPSPALSRFLKNRAPKARLPPQPSVWTSGQRVRLVSSSAKYRQQLQMVA